MKIRFRQRIPNFIEHNPKDLLDMEFEDIADWYATDFCKWYTDDPYFSHFAITTYEWCDRRMVMAVWKDLGRPPAMCGWFDKPSMVDLRPWTQQDLDNYRSNRIKIKEWIPNTHGIEEENNGN